MKKLYILFIALFSLVACDPMGDIHDEVDAGIPDPSATFSSIVTSAGYTSISNAALKDATNAADSAIAKSIKDKNALPEGYAALYIPAIIKNTHPNLNTGSVCNVTYNVQGIIPDYSNYQAATEYKVTNADYDSIGGAVASNKCFLASSPLSKHASGILAKAYPAAVADDMVLVIYKYADVEGAVSYEAGTYYSFNGSKWNETTGVYYLSNKDYESMGNPGPGRNNNFSSSISPDDYLPKFMSIKFPYVAEGTSMVVVYKYYASGATSKIAEEYTLNSNVWGKENYITTQTDQFIRTKEDWFFDPTIRYTMLKDDYQAIVNVIIADPDRSKLIDRGNSEFYYGASAYGVNYDLRVHKRITGDFAQAEYTSLATEQERLDLIFKRMEESIGIFLKLKYPDAVTQSNGIDVFYEITVNTFEDNNVKRAFVIKYQCTKSAPNPEFTFVERTLK